jgi:hypothetical protein
MWITIAIVLLIVIATCIAFSKKKFLCSSCRYLAKRNRTGIHTDTCRLLGCPACTDECRFYERVGTYK